MGHELNFARGRASMFSVQEVPWHGLGIVVPEKLTSKEAIIAAQLDYEVLAGEAYLKYEPSTVKHLMGIKGIPVDNTFFTYRGDTGEPLCTNGKAVTSQYQIIQNVDAFDFFDSIVGEGKAIFETAGALRKGETVFITAKLPDSAFLTPYDKIDQYLLMSLSHDGTSSVTVMFTPIRVVCNNTLHAALGSKGNSVRVRHSASYKEKLETAKSILGLASNNSTSLLDVANRLADRRISDHTKRKLICSTFLTAEELRAIATRDFSYTKNDLSTKKQNILIGVDRYMTYGPGQDLDTAKDTLWGFVNGITGYFQNSKSYIKGGNENNEHKFNNLFGGTAERISRRAFALAEQELY